MKTEMFKVFKEVPEIKEETVFWFDDKQKEMRTIIDMIQDFQWQPTISDHECIDMVSRIIFFLILVLSKPT